MSPELQADVTAIESLFGILCGQKDCEAAWYRIRTALEESQKPSHDSRVMPCPACEGIKIVPVGSVFCQRCGELIT